MDTTGSRNLYTGTANFTSLVVTQSGTFYFNPEQDFRDEVLKGLQSIDKNLDLIRKALTAKKKKNAKR